MTPAASDGARWAAAAASAGQTSVRELFRTEYAPMVRLAYTLTRDQHEAEEIVQDAFVDVQARWATLLNPGGYLRTAVVNAARRRGRRSENRRRILRARLPDIAGRAHHVDVHDHIIDALDTLPANQRTALILAYYLGLGSKEIAEIMGCRPGTASSHVHRGLKRLRKELQGERMA